MVGRAYRAAVAAGVMAAVLVTLLVAPGVADARLVWTGPVVRDTSGSGPVMTAIACPSATDCVALDAQGGVVSFTPGTAAPQVAPTLDTAPMTALTCPSATRCIAVDTQGREVVFDPTAPGAATTTSIDAGHALIAINCVGSTTSCVGVDADGGEVTFDASPPAGASRHVIDTTTTTSGSTTTTTPVAVTGVVCQTATSCLAVDVAGHQLVFNPQTGSVTANSSVSGNALGALVCPTSTQCLAFDGNGGEVIVNPQQSGSVTSTQIDSGHGITSAACASATQCVVTDANGAVVLFDPGSAGQRVSISSVELTAVTCPSASACVALDQDGHALTFDTTAAHATTTLVDGMPHFSAVACPSATQCTAADVAGNELTFNPRTSAQVSSASVDSAAGAIYGVACPATTQCTAVDDRGDAVTFNPQSPGSPAPVSIVKNHPLLAIACPSSVQCTVVDDDQYEVTFNPQAPTSGRYGVLGTPSGTSITGVACPTTLQCTAVDAAGGEVSFDPQNPGTLKPTSVFSDSVAAIACPTTTLCTALDAAGARATFDPHTPTLVSRASVDPAGPAALVCPSSGDCVTVDGAGKAVEFDPSGATGASGTVAAGTAPTAVACASVAECVTVDSTGQGFVGIASLPSAPTSLARPTISGTARVGSKLVGAHGRWTGAPTSYREQWLRCSATATACTAIAGATGLSYTLTAADVGHRVELRETAVNAGGAGAPQFSLPSTAVLGAYSAPTFSGASLTGVRKGAPELALTLTAGRYGPELKTFTLALSPQLVLSLASHTAQGVPSGIVVSRSGRQVAFSVRKSGSTLIFTLAQAVSSVDLRLGRPSLSATSALVGAVAAGHTHSLPLTVSVTAPGGHVLTRSIAVGVS